MGVQSLSLMYDIFEREDFNIMFQGEELSAKFSPWQLARASVFSVTSVYLIFDPRYPRHRSLRMNHLASRASSSPRPPRQSHRSLGMNGHA
jgi:hypothetical protein